MKNAVNPQVGNQPGSQLDDSTDVSHNCQNMFRVGHWRRSRARVNGVVGCAGLIVLLLAGCGETPPPATAVVPKTGVRTETELGPVRVTVEVAPAPARLSDEPTLTITINAKAGVLVQLPPFGDAVGDFTVLDFREPLVEVRGDREVTRQIYALEPPRTGMLEIDPVLVTFTDPRPGVAGTQRLETEALAVEVVSLVESEAPTLDELQGFGPPVELARPFRWWPWVVGACVAMMIALSAAIWWRRRTAKFPSEPELSPREIAALALQRIWHEELHVRDTKLFYTELTGIVRRYIEGTVGVRAPEQTTEEFLREISAGRVFSEEERRRLRSFLESSDLVKFAAHQPDREDIDDAYQRARDFVGIEDEQTATEDGQVAGS